MKTNIFVIIVLCLFFGSCKSTSKTAQVEEKQRLEGAWELNYIKDSTQKLEELYSRRIPLILFDHKQNTISGNNGCNSFSGKFIVNGNTISFKGPMTETKMYCEGQGEFIFMQNLDKTQAFSISKDGKVLQFTQNEDLLMRFTKK